VRGSSKAQGGGGIPGDNEKNPRASIRGGYEWEVGRGETEIHRFLRCTTCVGLQSRVYVKGGNSYNVSGNARTSLAKPANLGSSKKAPGGELVGERKFKGQVKGKPAEAEKIT